MRKVYSAILKQFFYGRLLHTRAEKGYTQAQMAELLIMDDRSYIDLEHGRNGCSATTLALFLAFVCEDPVIFIEDLNHAFHMGTDQSA